MLVMLALLALGGRGDGGAADGSVGRVSTPTRTRRPLEKHPTGPTAAKQSVLERYRQSLVLNSPTRTVYASRLPYNVTERELWDLFVGQEEGTGEGALTAVPEGAVRIPRNATGWGKGFAFVTLPSSDRLQHALSLDGTLWRGRNIVIKVSKKPDGCDTVFVGNLAGTLSPADVERLLSHEVAGRILSIRASDPRTGANSSPWGGEHASALGWFVQLENRSCVDETVRRLAGRTVAGRRLVVDFAESRKTSPPGAAGQENPQENPRSTVQDMCGNSAPEEGAGRGDLKAGGAACWASDPATFEEGGLEESGPMSADAGPTRTVFVENLDYGVGERRLLEALNVSKLDVLKVDWGLDPKRMIFKGHAHVTFR